MIQRPLLRVLLASILYLFISCREEKPPISPEKWSLVLTDIHLAEAWSTYLVPDSLRQSELRNDSMKHILAAVLQKHQLSEVQFREYMNWYQTHVEWLDSSYQLVLNQLALKQADHHKK